MSGTVLGIGDVSKQHLTPRFSLTYGSPFFPHTFMSPLARQTRSSMRERTSVFCLSSPSQKTVLELTVMNMSVDGSLQRDKSKPDGMPYLCPVSFMEETVGMHIIKG